MNRQAHYIIVFGFVERLSPQDWREFLRVAFDHPLPNDGLDHVLGMLTEKGQIEVLSSRGGS
jgi:hypothetical protein